MIEHMQGDINLTQCMLLDTFVCSAYLDRNDCPPPACTVHAGCTAPAEQLAQLQVPHHLTVSQADHVRDAPHDVAARQ